MQNIIVRRYPVPTAEERAALPPGVEPVSDSWQGYLEPDDLSWIMFIAADGTVTLFDERDPGTGAVVPSA